MNRVFPNRIPILTFMFVLAMGALIACEKEPSGPVSQPAKKEVGLSVSDKHGEGSTDVLLAITPEKGFEDIQPVNQVSVITSDHKIILRSTGIDPFVLLPLSVFPQDAKLVCQIEITSPADTAIQLFFLTEDTPDYTGEHSIARDLKKGHNIVSLPLSSSHITGRLRLDPGSTAGDYEIHKIEVHAIHGETE